MKLELNIQNTENVSKLNDLEVKNIEKIVLALVTSGGLSGVKGGQTVIHFDPSGKFMGIQLNYWPWRLREHDR